MATFPLCRSAKFERQAARPLQFRIALAQLVTVVVASLLFTATQVSAADAVTATYFEQLRLRHLFSVAEGYCIDRLAAEGIPDQQRGVLTLELARTLTEHARHVSADESAELFDRAAKTLDEFLTKEPPHPQKLVLEAERALIPAIHGELLRWQAELSPHDEKLRAQTLVVLDDATRRLPAIEQILAERHKADVARAKRDPDEPAPHEIRAVLNTVRFALGTSLLERAKLFSRGSAERVGTLIEADEWLRKVATASGGDELTVTSQVRLAESNRLRGDFKQALAMLTATERTSPPPQVVDQIVSQRVQVFLDLGKLDEAVKAITEYTNAREGTSGELLYVKLRTLIAQWQRANEATPKDAALASEILDQINAQVARGDREVGGYWAARCRALASGVHATAEFGGELADLVRAAQGALVSGNIERAVASYAKAAATAARNGRSDQADEFTFTRASILLEAGRFEDAGAAFHQIVEQNAAGPKAAEANLLWAWCAGKIYEKSRSAGDGEKFATALIEHRKSFGRHSTAADATAMLAEYEERHGNFSGALKLYLEIPPQHARRAESEAAVARCYEQILAELEQKNQPRDAVEREAISRVDQFAAAFPPESEALNVHQAEVALRLARMRMNQSRPDYARADRLLERALASAPTVKAKELVGTSEAWKAIAATAARLRIVSLAAHNRLPEAHEFVRRLSTASVGEVLGVLDGLAEAATRVEPIARRGLGELQLNAAEEIADQREKLSPADALRLNRCLAEAYLATGQPTKAIAAYESLLKSGPRNKQMLRTVAGLLVQCGTDACFEKALVYFRQIETQEKKGSSEWLRTSYDIAFCCLKLKQFDECRKIVRVTRVLYPELGGSELKAKFDQLERDLQSASQK